MNSMSLTWETSYAIALALKHSHSDVNLEEVTMQQVYAWTLQLSEFEDDPSLCNDGIRGGFLAAEFRSTR